MTPGTVERARMTALRWLVAQDAPESVIGAHEAGMAEDTRGAARWVSRILADQDPNGAWRGDLIVTASALITVAEVRSAASLREQDPGIGRALDWLRARRGEPGAWTDGCSDERHRMGICHHFLGGFLSPGPPDVPQAPASLPCGAPITHDSEARFVASVMALRALLVWTNATADMRLHLEGLRRVVRLWPESPPPGLSMTSLLAAVQVLLRSPVAEDRTAARQALLVIGGKQRGDGSWVEIDPFQALEVFGAAESEDEVAERARRALWHGAKLLVTTQNENGSWGGEAPHRRALIALRTLGRVDRLPSA